MKYKLPPLSDDIENHLSWYSDHKADRIRSLIQSYAIAALEQQRQIEAQGVPDGLLNVLDNFEKKERSPFQAYLAAGLVNELRTAMLASAPPAPQAKPIGWLYDWTHSSALGKPDEHFTSFTTDEEHARKHSNARQVFSAAQQAKQQPLSDEQKDAVLSDVVDMLSKQHDWLTRTSAINLVAGLYGRAGSVLAHGITKE